MMPVWELRYLVFLVLNVGSNSLQSAAVIARDKKLEPAISKQAAVSVDVWVFMQFKMTFTGVLGKAKSIIYLVILKSIK